MKELTRLIVCNRLAQQVTMTDMLDRPSKLTMHRKMSVLMHMGSFTMRDFYQ